MFATACPEGYSRRIRSTSSGVYSMPTPTPNIPTQKKNSISFHGAGRGIPNQTIAWMSTHIPDSDATEAARVCM